jgi:hypothetical protein
VISTAFYVSLLFTFNDCFGPGSTGVTEVPGAPKAD